LTREGGARVRDRPGPLPSRHAAPSRRSRPGASPTASAPPLPFRRGALRARPRRRRRRLLRFGRGTLRARSPRATLRPVIAFLCPGWSR